MMKVALVIPSKELATDEDEQRLSSSRWLLVSSRGDGITTHTVFYRPEPLLDKTTKTTPSAVLACHPR